MNKLTTHHCIFAVEICTKNNLVICFKHSFLQRLSIIGIVITVPSRNTTLNLEMQAYAVFSLNIKLKLSCVQLLLNYVLQFVRFPKATLQNKHCHIRSPSKIKYKTKQGIFNCKVSHAIIILIMYESKCTCQHK